MDFDGDGQIDLLGSPGTPSAAWPATCRCTAGRPAGRWRSRASLDSDTTWRRCSPTTSRRPSTAPPWPATACAPSTAGAGKAAFVELVTPGEDSEYWLGYQNFYVITRYKPQQLLRDVGVPARRSGEGGPDRSQPRGRQAVPEPALAGRPPRGSGEELQHLLGRAPDHRPLTAHHDGPLDEGWVRHQRIQPLGRSGCALELELVDPRPCGRCPRRPCPAWRADRRAHRDWAASSGIPPPRRPGPLLQQLAGGTALGTAGVVIHAKVSLMIGIGGGVARAPARGAYSSTSFGDARRLMMRRSWPRPRAGSGAPARGSARGRRRAPRGSAPRTRRCRSGGGSPSAACR